MTGGESGSSADSNTSPRSRKTLGKSKQICTFLTRHFLHFNINLHKSRPTLQ